MSSAIKSVTKEIGRGLTNYTVVGALMDDDSAAVEDTSEQDAQDAAQADATNAARVASTKKKYSSSSVLTSPLGSSTSATTAISKLGGS